MAKSNSSIMFLQETIDSGLNPVALHIKNALKQDVYITDYIGHVCYPLPNEDENSLARKILEYPLYTTIMEIPEKIDDGDYYYQEETQYFCFALGEDDTRAYIIIDNLPAKSLSKALNAIKEVQLALRYYFIAQSRITEHNREFEKGIIEFFFKRGSMHYATLFKFCDTELDQYRRFFVSITQIAGGSEKVNTELLQSFIREHFKRVHKVVIPIVGDNELFFIIPEVNQEGSLEPDKLWPYFDTVNLFNKELQTRFNISTATGIGSIHSLEDLDKSYKEARIALTIPKLLEKTDFVQNFNDLGIFRIIFTDIDRYKSFALKFLEKLIDYDQKNEGELLFTLQSLVSNNFNHKETADSLYIHVNTLHYRISKISEILNVDFLNMGSRFNIYTSVIIYSTLKLNDWL